MLNFFMFTNLIFTDVAFMAVLPQEECRNITTFDVVMSGLSESAPRVLDLDFVATASPGGPRRGRVEFYVL